MTLFEVTNTTWESLQIATHKSVSFTLHIVLICALQFADFSGCVCHLEQRHAQSPFLFPIVFSVNLIPFFNICSVLAVLSPGLFGYVLLYLGHCVVATVAVCGFGGWSLVFHCGMARQISPLPPTLSQTEVCSTMGESIRVERLRPSSFHNQHPPQISTSYKFAAPRYRLPCRMFRWASNLTFQRHWKIAQSCRNHKD